VSASRGPARKTWAGAVAIVAVGLLAAALVVLTSQRLASLEAERHARAAAADAVMPVADALRTQMSADTAGTAAAARQVAVADATSAGIPTDVATRARDSGTPVLIDSGAGLVVAATYDTPAAPQSVEERRVHETGLRVVPLALSPTLDGLRPSGGGISLAGPERTVLSLPGPRPHGRTMYAVKLAPDPAPDWTLSVWTATPPVSMPAWFAALGMFVLGLVLAGWFARRDGRLRRSQQELRRLQETSVTTAGLATVAQHSLDLADLLPALTTELTDALGLQGLALDTPSADGERPVFAWGVAPAEVPATSQLPDGIRGGQTLCLDLARGGRTVARLRVVAGRDLDGHDVNALGAATEVLTSALLNAEAFARQRDLVQRMKSVDELKTVFLATASHELRTPVAAISGYAQLLSGSWDTLSPEEGRMYAARVDSNARRLGALVDDLLDFSRLERGGEFTAADSVLDLGEVVSRFLDDRPDLAPDHQLVTDLVPGLEVVGSAQAVERVVSNLLGNAEKYSPSGTVIRVSVRASLGRVELAVDDQGPGVPASERDQIFSRFFRGRGDSVVSTRGVGLGLAIVSEFAGTMGGEVSVAASDSGGARFVVSYPRAVASESIVEGAADVRA
jgi:signal transduction histidine kinase